MREQRRVRSQNVEVHVSQVLDATGVVRVALEYGQPRLDLDERVDGALNVADFSCAGGQDDRLLLLRDVAQHLDPSDVARADLVDVDIGVEHVYSFEVVSGGEEIDAGRV